MQITGLCDRSGSFGVNVIQRSAAHPWNVRITFEVLVPIAYIGILHELVEFFGVGKVYTSGLHATYRVTRLSDLVVIMNHFKLYPLITSKVQVFILWAEALEIVQSKQHLTDVGMSRVMSISGTTGRGMNKALITAKPSLVTAVLPPYVVPTVINPWWISGFLSVYSSFTGRHTMESWRGYMISKWKHAFTVGFDIRNLEIAKLISRTLNIAYYITTDSTRVNISAQTDDECVRVFNFLSNHPLLGPKVELVTAW